MYFAKTHKILHYFNCIYCRISRCIYGHVNTLLIQIIL